MFLISTFKTKPKKDTTDEALRPIIFPIALKHGLFWGLLAGLILWIVLPQPGNPHLLQFLGPLLVDTAIGMIVMLVLVLALLRLYWQPVSRQQQIVAGAILGATFSLIMSGSYIAEHVIKTMSQTYAIQSRCGLSTISDSNCLYEVVLNVLHFLIGGIPLLGLAYITIFTVIGGGLGFILLRRTAQPVKRQAAHDPFTSLFFVSVPVALLFAYVLNFIGISISEAVTTAAGNSGISEPPNGVAVLALIPLLLIVIIQMFGINWIRVRRAGELHRGTLRLTQVIMGLFLGVLIIPLMLIPIPMQQLFYLEPGKPLLAFLPTQIFTAMIVVLAWIFVRMVQHHFRICHETGIESYQVPLLDKVSLVGIHFTIALFVLNLFFIQPMWGIYVTLMRATSYGAF